MIEATDIIHYDRTIEEMEELILFLICVAGKNADTTARALEKFFYMRDFKRVSPFQQIREIDTVSGMLLQRIKDARLGCYTKLEKAFRQIANSGIDLTTCDIYALMEIHGVGRKSASCFLAWTRKDVKVAMLDTHLLKFLKAEQEKKIVSYCEDPILDIHRRLKEVTIPKSTPSSKKLYDALEGIYLELCEYSNVNPTEFDLQIWKQYAKRI